MLIRMGKSDPTLYCCMGLLHGKVLAFAFALVVFHRFLIALSSSLSRSFWTEALPFSSQFHISCTRARSGLYRIIQVTNKVFKQSWPQDWSQRHTTGNWLPVELYTTNHHHPLAWQSSWFSVHLMICSPIHILPIWLWDTVGDHVKGLVKVKMNNTHCPYLSTGLVVSSQKVVRLVGYDLPLINLCWLLPASSLYLTWLKMASRRLCAITFLWTEIRPTGLQFLRSPFLPVLKMGVLCAIFQSLGISLDFYKMIGCILAVALTSSLSTLGHILLILWICTCPVVFSYWTTSSSTVGNVMLVPQPLPCLLSSGPLFH